jgi:uncharacterized membrane protein YoaK (UPF0700 family)
MKKTFLTLLMAAAVGAAGLTAAPQKAEAFWWVIPAIVGGAAMCMSHRPDVTSSVKTSMATGAMSAFARNCRDDA